jgi:hypothetical protein
MSMARAKADDTIDLSGLAQQEARRVQAILKLRTLRNEARQEITRLISFLDQSDDYVTTELEDDDDREQVGDEEPSLGSFDRMVNQEKSYRQGDCDIDCELDDSDREEDDAAEESDTGVGDQDGLDEQVPFRDWQGVGMV